jgi:hypothetical protein
MVYLRDQTLNEPVLIDLYNYWDTVRAGRKYVVWDEVDPVEMPRHVLPNIIVVQMLSDGDLFYRLSGTTVDESLGVVVQGKRLSELPIDQCQELTKDYRGVIENVEPQVFTFPLSTAANRFRETIRLCLPVASVIGKVDMILGAVDYRKPEKDA